MKPDRKKIKRIAKHSVFWLIILAFQVSRSGGKIMDVSGADFMALVVEHSLMLPILMAISYFFAYYLLPRYFSTRRYLPLIIFSVLGFITAILLMRIILYFFIIPTYYPVYQTSSAFWSFNLAQYTFYILSTVAIVVMIKYTGQMRQMEKVKNQLEKQNLSSELALLRSQVNPHFLFNTLNNINALVKKDPERTNQSILKLSDIMRYMLFEAANEKVHLVKEIEYIRSYIGLLSLRLEKADYIRFSVTGEPQQISLPPMLFIPFVENAFKHGLKDADSPGILISLNIGKERLNFEVRNFIKSPSLADTPDSKGIGIVNLKRRLELLYPDKHILLIRSDGKEYFCRLELDLTP